ncbi:unnamed protein product [Oikopleura dioica]|uniref:Uncharacterized protein n=1 Tax=Oikopleura dioica TaxID=34765 RepID=E4Y2D7_OIKDI|nr:unnamed protein product [Oikopleura dioica]
MSAPRAPIIIGSISCITALPLGLYWHIRQALPNDSQNSQEPHEVDWRTRASYIIVLSCEMMALVAVFAITMARKLLKK